MSPRDLTESGDRYNPAVLARATQYDAIIEKAAACHRRSKPTCCVPSSWVE